MIDYSAKTDEELVALSRENDSDARDALLKRYKSFVKQIVRRLFDMDVDIEDVMQEGIIAVNKCIDDYRDDKNAQFKTFAATCVKCRVYDMMRAAYKSPRIVSSAPDDTSDFVDVGENFDALLAKIKEVLSEDENKLFTMYIDGYTYAEIAEALLSDVKKVDNLLQKIKKKLRKILKD